MTHIVFVHCCRDRRELEAREKDRVKMERDKLEREKRLQREEEERKIREEKERQKNQVTQHFEESLRLAEQKVRIFIFLSSCECLLTLFCRLWKSSLIWLRYG